MKKGIYALLLLGITVIAGVSFQNTSKDIAQYATAYDLQALNNFQIAIKQDPQECSLAYAGIGDIYYKYGFLDEAIKNYKAALDKGLNFNPLAYAIGAGYYKVGLHQRLACAYFQKREYDKAIEHFTKAVINDAHTYNIDYFTPSEQLEQMAKMHYKTNNFEQLKRDYYSNPEKILKTIAYLSKTTNK